VTKSLRASVTSPRRLCRPKPFQGLRTSEGFAKCKTLRKASGALCAIFKNQTMQNLTDKLKRIKVDCLYGKKNHFNAGDRHEKSHYRIGIPLIVINVLTGSVLFYVLTDGVTNWIKFVPLFLALVAAILSGFQTYLNLPQKVEGHRRIGNRYLSVM